MSQIRESGFFERADQLEIRLCILINSSSKHTYMRRFFQVISRLGDGVFWYMLIALLPYLHGRQGLTAAMHILISGIFVLLTYKFLKTKLLRERPFISSEDIQKAAPALDQYSFPSGHTMHAFSFAVLFSKYLPELSVVIWGFAGLVAMSRVILGLHYPTDVVAGALLGSSMALLSLIVIAV